MTLEEAITKCLIGEEHLDQAEYEQVGEWLEELNKVSQELEIYKKALHSACYEISGDTTQSLIDFYLQKAREEE